MPDASVSPRLSRRPADRFAESRGQPALASPAPPVSGKIRVARAAGEPRDPSAERRVAEAEHALRDVSDGSRRAIAVRPVRARARLPVRGRGPASPALGRRRCGGSAARGAAGGMRLAVCESRGGRNAGGGLRAVSGPRADRERSSDSRTHGPWPRGVHGNSGERSRSARGQWESEQRVVHSPDRYRGPVSTRSRSSGRSRSFALVRNP
jgi:hypothetical protein